MKKLLAFALFFASPAWADRMDEILMMTLQSMSKTLGVNHKEVSVKITFQDFTKAAPQRDLAVKSILVLTNINTQENQEWTCVTQFVKTPKFFEVSETECK